MPAPATIRIHWIESLYSASLAANLSKFLDAKEEVEAVVCKAFGWEYWGIIEERYYEEGDALLVRKGNAYEIEDIPGGAEKPLQVWSQFDHLYRQAVPSCEVDGLCWRVCLHPDFVLVLPARVNPILEIGDETLLLMEAPQSNHQRIGIDAQARHIQSEINRLYRFAFPAGVALDDHEGYLSEDFH